MQRNSFAPLRIIVIGMLILLAVQFELGITVTLSDPAELPPFAFSLTRVSDALHAAGTTALAHAILGVWLAIFSLGMVFLAWRSGDRRVVAVATLAFLTAAGAAATGFLFTVSGFRDDGASHGMASNFLLTFTFFFLGLYLLKRTSGVPGV
jgi:hypothetical protein